MIIKFNELFFALMLGLLLLFLFHFESITFGPLKVSQLWKGLLLIFLFVNVVRNWKIKSSIYNPLFLISFITIFSLETILNPLNAFSTFLLIIIIPFIGLFALDKDIIWCKKTILFISCFYILSFTPYELGFLTPLVDGYDLARSYGFDVQGSIGPFQTVHSASTALAGALLVIFYFLLTSDINRPWFFLIFLIGFYFLFNTYARTGMAMFAVGVLIMLLNFSYVSMKMIFRVGLLVAAVLSLAIAWVLPNDAVIARITGERLRSTEGSSLAAMGSGRGWLAMDSLEIYSEANPIEKIIGMGITEQKRRMSDKRGVSLVPHNGFLSILLHTGLVGILLFFWFLKNIWRLINKFSNKNDKAFLRSLLSAYVVMTFTQQFDIHYMPVLLMLAFAWKLKSNHIVISKKS
jgi:hypothetical protein